MRLDPDIILVGEIRDQETAETATQAALTGHLVLSSIHANDAASALFRLANLGVERYLVASGVIGIVAQRLVRCICPHCKVLTRPTEEQRAAYRSALDEKLTQYYIGEGCNFCRQTGYMGRTGVFEVLVMSGATQQLLLQGASASEIKADAEKRGMIPMRRDGMLKVKRGVTTPEEVMRMVYTID
jgi:general secretion pathway protein E